jgi:hypothetical protein
MARYPQGGGHWMVRLQHLLGLKDLGHDVFLLEILRSTGDAHRDQQCIKSFFEGLQRYGLNDQCALLLYDKAAGQRFESADVYGKNRREVRDTIKDADLLWNDCCGVRQPLLGMFRHRVLIDLDPGHLQVSALTVNMDLQYHDTFLTVGQKLHDADCEVPTLGFSWHPFAPVIYLSMWDFAPDPGREAPFSSITHWTWAELWLQDRVLSISKRDAYLRYLELPRQTMRPFELRPIFIRRIKPAIASCCALTAGNSLIRGRWRAHPRRINATLPGHVQKSPAPSRSSEN